MGLRETILGLKPPNAVKVACPEWGCDVYVRGLSGDDREDVEAQSAELAREANYAPGAGKRLLRARVVVRAARDADGKRIFSDEDAEDLSAREGWSKVIDRVYEITDRLSALTQDEVDTILGNSGGDPPGSPPSASPSPVVNPT